MKKPFTYALLASLALSSCSWQQMGSLTMVSTRNVDQSKEYAIVARAVEARVNSRGNALQAAIDKAVTQVPGGEYMMNVNVYVNKNGERVRVTGDVWGHAQAAATSGDGRTAAIQPGDAVVWKQGSAIFSGTVVSLQGLKAVVEYDRNGQARMREVDLKKLTKR